MMILGNSKVFIVGLASALMHETGHLLAMIYKNHRLSEIKIGFFCIDIIDSKRNLITYQDDIFILLSGPLVNLLLSLVFLLFYGIRNLYFFKLGFCSNFLLFLTNLLPISTLDGGQILYLLLSKRLSIDKVEHICEVISFLFLVPLAVAGFLILFKSKYNFSLLYICCALMVLLVVKARQ